MTLFSKLIIGTNGADKITATDESHLILADGGDDIITSGSGNDFIYGGAGNDVLHGGDGDNVFVLGSDLDVVKDFTQGSDTIQIALDDADTSTIDALLTAAGLRTAQEVVNDYHSDYQDRTDTYIYDNNGTANIADDTALMVLEDFSQDLTVSDFSII